MNLSAWVFSLLVASVPLDRPSLLVLESSDERRERYASIADDIAAAVESDSRPKNAAALLVAVAVHESSLDAAVDAPECHPVLIARHGCDGGHARSLWQLHAWYGETRAEAAKEALRRLRASERACSRLPESDRYASYARGVCESLPGQALSRDFVRLTRRLEVRP